jgi:hypothetical protein
MKQTYRVPAHLTIAIILALGTNPATYGQGGLNTQIDRFQLNQLQTPYQIQYYDVEEERGATPTDDAMIPLEDGGRQRILREGEKPKMFTVFGGGGINYTSNVALAKNNAQADAYWSSQIGTAFNKEITENLFLGANVGYQWFLYHKFNFLNFNALNARAGLSYIVPKLEYEYLETISGGVATIGYNYTNLFATGPGSSGDSFYSANAIDIGYAKTWPFQEKLALTFAWNSEFSIADPSSSQRDTHAAGLTGSWYPIDRLELQAFWRGALITYEQNNRNDWNNTIGVTLRWSFTPYTDLLFNLSQTFNNSDQAVFSYNTTNLGAALNLRLRF